MTFQVAIFDGTDTKYVPATTISAKSTEYSYSDLSSTTADVTYGVPANAADEILVTVNTTSKWIKVTHGDQGNSETTQRYYVVGTWFEGGFDQTDYNERRFQMKKNPDGTFYFDIPANMQLTCQILSSTGTLYYPDNGGNNYELKADWTTVADQTVASSAKPASGTTGTKWYFNGTANVTASQGVAHIDIDDTKYMDGYFRLTFNPTTAKWSVSYSTTRVSYISAAVNDWKVDFLYDSQRDHRHFGSSYIDLD